MGLSYDLISEFVKITNDKKEGPKEGTVYATVVNSTGGKYVKIDGSDLLTPIDTTTGIEDGERVTVMIKDHKATVTGNITSPSVGKGTVNSLVGAVVDENLVGINADIENLIAKNAYLENVFAQNSVIIDSKIENLVAKDTYLENTYAENATIIDSKIENLEATDSRIENSVIENFQVIDGVVQDLKATNADIKVLNADFAQIKTLVNGNLTSDNILSFNITSGKVTVDDAFIKDAMIDTISAGKINAGKINTNSVSIGSEDGGMLITGSTQQFTDKNGNVRIQIGKDASGDFTFILYGENGQGQIINQNGITASAIGDGLIVNNMVSDNAAISGGKLDISSVITEINSDNSTTIKSSKIYLNDQAQSLEVAFNSLKTQVDTIQEVTIKGDLTAIVEQVQSNTSKIEVNKNSINTLISEDTVIKKQVTDLQGTLSETETTLNSKYTTLSQNLDGFKTTVANTYATKKSVTDVVDNIEANYSTTSVMNSAIEQKAQEISASVSSTYATKNQVNTLDNTLRQEYSTTQQMESAINVAKEEINLGVSNIYETKENTTSKIQNAVNNIQVGGTNLWVLLDLKTGYEQNGNINESTAPHKTRNTIIPTNGAKHLVYQCWNPNKVANNSNTNRVAFFNSSKAYISSTQVLVLNGQTYQWQIINIPENTAYVRLGAICGSADKYDTTIKIKFEFGNKPTDYSLAPEDVINDISTAKTEAITSANDTLTTTISNYYTKSQTDSQINVAKEAINLGVSTTYETKENVETKVTSTLNSAKSYADTKKSEAISTAATDATSKANTAKQEAIASANNTLTTTISNYYTKSQTDSQINVAKEAIDLSVSTNYETKTNVETKVTSTLNSAKSYADTKKSEAISTAATDATSKINSIKIGGSNLITKKSNFVYGYISSDNGTLNNTESLNNNQDFYTTEFIFVKNGTPITFTSYPKQGVTSTIQNAVYIHIYNTDKVWQVSALNVTSADAVASKTYTTTSDCYVRFCSRGFNDYNHMAEFATKPSEWRPSPNDVDSNISTAKSEAIASANNTLTTTIANYYTKTQTDSQINVAKEAINLGVSNTYETKTNVETKVTSTLNSAKSYADTKKSEAISTAATDATSKVTTAVNNIQVGGTNLWVLLDLKTGYEQNGNINESTAPHKTRQTLVSTNGAKQLVYQCWNPNKVSNNSNTNRVAFFDSSKAFISSKEITKLNGNSYQSQIIDIPTNAVYMRLGAICGSGDVYDTTIKIKFELGNKPTDYSIAPEDVKNDISTAKSEAISTAATDATSKANKAKTDAIKSANNTLTTTIANYYTKEQTDSQIKIAKDAIDLSVSTNYETKTNVESKIKGIIVGGTNLAFDTNKGITSWNWSMQTNGGKTITEYLADGVNGVKMTKDANDASGWNYVSYGRFKRDKITPATTYVVSFEMKSNKTFNVGSVNLMQGDSSNTLIKSITAVQNKVTANSTAWSKIIFRLVTLDTLPSSTSQVIYITGIPNSANATHYFRNLKLEVGNTPTTWSPAPEDVTSDITTAKNDAIKSANNTLTSTIANYYTKEQTDSQINIAKNAINLSVSETYETKSNVTSKVDSTLKSAKSYADTKKSEAISTASEDATSKANKAKTDAINAAASDATSKVNKINVGSVNRFVGTSKAFAMNMNNSANYTVWDPYFTPNKQKLSELGFKSGDQVTISFDWEISKNGNNDFVYGNFRSEFVGYSSSGAPEYKGAIQVPVATFSASNTKGRAEKTVTLNDTNLLAVGLRIRIDNSVLTLTISNVKMEKGNKATSWSPAPEDIESDITAIESETKSLKSTVSSLQLGADSINASVKSLEESMVNTTNGLANDITHIQEQVNLKMSTDDVKLEIQKEMSKGANKVSTSTGFTFDQNGLNISKTDSEMKTQITEDGMKIYKNSEVMLTANNQGVDAKNLHATTYLIIGNNSRMEDFTEGGNKRTAVFWIG